MAKKEHDLCPCGSGKKLKNCCGPFLERAVYPRTALALMKSRYTAYALKNERYLLDTWHPDTRPSTLDLKQDRDKWIGLKILRTEWGNADDEEGIVEFVARFRVNGKAHRLHEVSRFVRVDGKWVYIEGQVPDQA